MISILRYTYLEYEALTQAAIDQSAALLHNMHRNGNGRKSNQRAQPNDKQLSTEIIKTANLLFSSFEPFFMWDFIGRTFEKVCAAIPPEGSQGNNFVSLDNQLSVSELCLLTEFLLEKVTLVSRKPQERVALLCKLIRNFNMTSHRVWQWQVKAIPSQRTLHTPASWASYGMSFGKKDGPVIKGLNCILVYAMKSCSMNALMIKLCCDCRKPTRRPRPSICQSYYISWPSHWASTAICWLMLKSHRASGSAPRSSPMFYPPWLLLTLGREMDKPRRGAVSASLMVWLRMALQRRISRLRLAHRVRVNRMSVPRVTHRVLPLNQIERRKGEAALQM